MKRTKPVSPSRTSGLVKPLAADELARVTGGATAIEYGLAIAPPSAA